MKEAYLKSAIKRFDYYRSVGLRSMEQLSDEDLFWHLDEESNSIAIIVNHLHGNMLSRWTNFLQEDGEKPWRERDAEFENRIKDRKELMAKWNEGWDLVSDTLNALSADDLDKEVRIRNEAHSVVDAINRQLAHYAYHVGQMVYVAKMRKGKQWKTLTIAKGKSKEFNRSMRK